MENISHSLPRRNYAGTVDISNKSVYDDVFGGPPKFGLPTLAPRFEDYTEIFGGFHSARSSSIPVLDLPVIDVEAGFHFDIRSPDFNYSEIFGNFGGLDFALSYEELVGHSSGGYDSSEDAWSPAQSESLSVESDPSASSGKHRSLSNGDHLQSFDDIKLFNVSSHKSNQRSMENIATGSTHVTQLPAISGYAYTFNDMSVSQTSEDERSSLHVSNDLDSSVGRGWTSAEEKLFIKGLSHPSSSETKHDLYEKQGKPKSTLSKPFITISDISLRTKPSGLPPPSRPPPAFAVKNGESDKPNAKLKAFNDSVFERSDSSSLFFDVEVDASSSAEAMKDATERAQAKYRNAKESVEGNEGLQSHIKLHLVNDTEEERKTSKTLNVTNRFKDEMPQSYAKEAEVPKPLVEEKRSLTENNKVISDSIDGKNNIHFVEKSVDTVAWSEATDFFEVIDTSLPKRASKIKDGNILVQNMRSCSYRNLEKASTEAHDLMEDCKNSKVVKEAPKWDEDRNQLEMDMEICDWAYNQGRLVATKKSSHQELQEEVQLDEMICKFDLNDRKTKVIQQHGQSEKVSPDPDGSVDAEARYYLNEVEAQQKLKSGNKTIEREMMRKDARLGGEKGMILQENIERPECERRLEEAVEHTDPGKRAREKLEQEEREKQQLKACEKEESNNKNNFSLARKENKNTQKVTFEPKGNEKILEGAVKHESSGRKSNIGLGRGKNCRDEQLDSKAWGENERLVESRKQEENEMEYRGIAQNKSINKDRREDHESSEIKERLSNAYRMEECEMENKELCTQKDDKRSVMIFKEEEIVRRSQAACDIEGNESFSEDADTWDELSGQDIEIELTEGNGHDGEVRNDQEKNVFMEAGNLEAFDGECEYNEGTLPETLVTGKHDSLGELEATRTAVANEENEKLVTVCKSSDSESNNGTNLLFNGKFNSSSQNGDDLQDKKGEKNLGESTCLPECNTNSKKAEVCVGNTRYVPEKSASEIVFNHENETGVAREEESGKGIKGVQSNIKKNETNNKSISGHAATELVQNGKKMVGASSFVLEERENKLKLGQQGPSHSTERKEKNLNAIFTTKDRKVDGRIQRERELANEHLRKLEEEREREREREKDRMSLGRAALEAHERSYAEARERAERVAVERATAEARQRAMSEARERLERASMEARFRTDRTPVERAAVEAWQRAVKKSLVEKNTFEVREQVERSVLDRFSGSSRCAEMRDTSLSELHDHQFRSTGNSNGLRYAYSSVHVGAEGESPQRCKARLERYQRTAERAAKALAEKNMRDILAQREQQERNRVAETLDVEVKRWSSGKEGNLRALLSTLQYILGPDSGWQPIPLTEVITSAAVKRAYRKATLCVHPDKLQQRGATIHQKYICEKVFDLLKEAWNKFNSEER